MKKIILMIGSLLLMSCASVDKPALAPFADMHLHYNWDHEELLSAKEAVAILDKHNIVLAAVSSVPSSYALKLAEAGGDWIIPFYSPYYEAGNRLSWFYDEKVIDRTREALASGKYHGIGEVHLMAGVGPRRDNPVFQGLLKLADEFEVPVLLHTDASSYQYLLPICQGYPKVRFLWAHAGGVIDAQGLSDLMPHCDNVWFDLAARDPWHYGYLTDEKGKLLPGWLDLIKTYPDRFITGTDPVWNAHQIYKWYEADQGWSHYDKFINYHRDWLTQLPEGLAKKIRLTNAQQFFNRQGRAGLRE
ncbi:MAG: amidohydrolase family protein [Thioalkalispiraceae bacterium]|jgi:predicted TIM-barrel fold metal-dependent hydrolase